MLLSYSCGSSAGPGLEVGEAGVANVVRLCGYLPLAISLMAGQLKHHPIWSADRTGRRASLGTRTA